MHPRNGIRGTIHELVRIPDSNSFEVRRGARADVLCWGIVLHQKRVRIAWQQFARFLGTSAQTRSVMELSVGRSVWEGWWPEGGIVTGVALVAGVGWTMRDQAACRT
jgi:hypothetical protein